MLSVASIRWPDPRLLRWPGPSSLRAMLWLLATVLLLVGVGIGLRDPWPADEPRFALIARDMLVSGDWFIPRRGPELYAEKPPLFLWLQALSHALVPARIAFLVPSLLAAIGVVLLTFDLGRRLWNRRIALHGALALALTVQFTLQARSAQIDAVLLLFTTLGLYGLLRHVLLGPDWRWYALGGFACGLGVITKGTGFLPLLLLLPYAWLRRRSPDALPTIRGGWRWSIAPLAMLAAIALWLLPLLWFAQHDPAIAAYRDELLFRQTVTRYANAWHHHRPAWYFLTNVIPGLWLPLSALLPWAIPAWRRRLRRGDPRQWLLLGWVVLVLMFFSASPGKREMYILPALPALALALAPLLPGLLRKAGTQRLLFAIALALAATLTLAAAWALLGTPAFAERIAQLNQVRPWPWLLATGALASALVLWLRPRRGAAAFAGAVATIWLGYGLAGYADLSDARSGRQLMSAVERTIPAHAELGLVGVPEQFLLQAQRPARAFGFKTPVDQQWSAALPWLSADRSRWLLAPRQRLSDCVDPAATIDAGISNRRAMRLIPAAAVIADCHPSVQPR